MRKIIAFLITFIITAMPVYGGGYYEEYTEPEIKLNIAEANVKIKFPNGETSTSLFCNGRLSVPLSEGVKLMGGKLNSVAGGYNIAIDGKNYFVNRSTQSNRPGIFAYNNMEYISLYEITAPFEYGFLPDVVTNSGEVLKENWDCESKPAQLEGKKAAYIRLEDITADGLKPDGIGNYTVDMLEKLKYTARYLYERNQEYYIAWIPVYADPAADYWNDVSKDYNLYNSYFLYVLDYMIDHNGHIGLHGYTHQYGNEESAIGYEWGDSTPYNFKEQSRRMAAAKEACHKLGYNEEFFEFPHYGATNEQMLMAEYYFDAVYQSYPSAEHTNYLTYTTRSGKKVYYIPTPADYVHFIRDASIFDRIRISVANGYTLSLFFHPVIDEKQIEAETVDGVRLWRYMDEATLPQIVDNIGGLGYSFGNFRNN